MPAYEPFAVVETSGRGGRVLSALNGAALAQGLVAGMALSDARAAVPAVQVVPGDPAQDARVLFALSQWAGRYGPSRGHEDGLDGFWSDVTGVAHLYGGEEELLRDLLGRLRATGIPARAAMAETYGASYALARYGVVRDGSFVCVPPGDVAAALAPLPVEALRLDGEVSLLLRRLGLKRIGDLYTVARVSLAHRFSSADAAHRVVLRLDQALGRRSEPLRPYVDLAPVVARRAFAEPLVSSAPLEAILDLLCQELAEALKAREEGARGVRFDYFRADGTSGSQEIRLGAFSNEAAHFSLLLRPRLGEIDAGFGIDLVALSVLQVGPCASEQTGFAQHAGAATDPGRVIDSLSNRLGSAAVRSLLARASHVPERSERHVSAINADVTSGTRGPAYTPPWPYQRGVRRPPFLLDRPEPIAVIAEVPDGPPARFTWRRVERRVARAQGPERIAPEWWRAIGRPQTAKIERPRDYYEIEDETGASYWVFRHGLYGGGREEDDGEADAPPPTWFLHGLFC